MASDTVSSSVIGSSGRDETLIGGRTPTCRGHTSRSAPGILACLDKHTPCKHMHTHIQTNKQTNKAGCVGLRSQLAVKHSKEER